MTADINLDELRSIAIKVENNSELINEVVDALVLNHCKMLDDLIQKIKLSIEDKDNPPTSEELDYYTLNMPVALYYASEAQEVLGIKEDVALATKKEIYNAIFEKAQKTVADKTAAAELASQAEYLTHVAYQRAYKKVKLRLEYANEILQSVKKVISRRMTEMELTRLHGSR